MVAGNRVEKQHEEEYIQFKHVPKKSMVTQGNNQPPSEKFNQKSSSMITKLKASCSHTIPGQP